MGVYPLLQEEALERAKTLFLYMLCRVLPGSCVINAHIMNERIPFTGQFYINFISSNEEMKADRFDKRFLNSF